VEKVSDDIKVNFFNAQIGVALIDEKTPGRKENPAFKSALQKLPGLTGLLARGFANRSAPVQLYSQE
jgi:hypothetical protein